MNENILRFRVVMITDIHSTNYMILTTFSQKLETN